MMVIMMKRELLYDGNESMMIMRELLSKGAYVPWIQDLITPAQYWHDPLNNTAFLEVPY